MTPLEAPNDNDDDTEGEDGAVNSPHVSLEPQPGTARDQPPIDIERQVVDEKRAVIYIRVSTKAQAERHGNPEGYSLPTQRLAGRLRAEELGAVVVDEYVDKDSGTRVDKRPAMLALIDRVETERDVDFVIVHQLSRFARNRLDDASITYRLE